MSSTGFEYDAIFEEISGSSLETASEWYVDERHGFDRSRSISEVIKPISPVDLNAEREHHTSHFSPTLRLDTLTVEISDKPETLSGTREKLTALSQQMRTLLQSIIGYSEIIEEDLRAGEQISPFEDIATIRKAGHQLLELAREFELQIDGERQKRKMAERLTALSEHALETSGPTPIYEALLEHLLAAIDFHSGDVTLTEQLEPLACAPSDTSRQIDETTRARLINSCIDYCAPCTEELPDNHHALAVPLLVQGKIVATLVLCSKEGKRFDAIHTGTAVAFAEQAARVLGALEYREQLNKRATYDNLTGLLNRATFLERAERKCTRHGLTGAIMMDIDHFKSINDTHGHAAGDKVLREVAHRLDATVRGSDEFGRLGGEEFALVLENVLAQDASDLAERLRRSIEARPFDIGDGKSLDVTVSVGVATANDIDVETLLARADEALYGAKHGGRNRVVVA